MSDLADCLSKCFVISLALELAGCNNAIDLFHDISRTVIAEPCVIRITGKDLRWHVQYQRPDGTGLFDGDGLTLQDIHVPRDANVVLVLTSNDYAYTLAIKSQGIRELAIPEMEFSVSLHPVEAGSFDLAGEELCGDPHPELQGHLIVESKEEFLRWLNSTRAGTGQAHSSEVSTTRK